MTRQDPLTASSLLAAQRRRGGRHRASLTNDLLDFGSSASATAERLLSWKNQSITDGVIVGQQRYQPALWERACSTAVAAVMLVVLYLMVRNEPFHHPDLVSIVRTVFSTTVAILGATLSNFFHLSWSGRGFTIRAGGVLARFNPDLPDNPGHRRARTMLFEPCLQRHQREYWVHCQLATPGG